MRPILGLLVTLLLVACAHRPSIDVYDWVGQTEQILVADWGYPQRTFKNAAGNTVYEYTNSRTMAVAMPAGVNTMVVPVTRSCTVWWEIENGVVKSGSFRGNGC